MTTVEAVGGGGLTGRRLHETVLNFETGEQEQALDEAELE